MAGLIRADYFKRLYKSILGPLLFIIFIDDVGNHPPLHFFGVTLEETDSMDLLVLTLNNNLAWNYV